MLEAAKEYGYTLGLHDQCLSIFMLDDSQFDETHTNAIQVIEGLFISLSGTNPTILLDLVCTDVTTILTNSRRRKIFAQLCGPIIYNYLNEHGFVFPDNVELTLSLDEIKAWQPVWLPIQNKVFMSSGQSAVVLFEGIHDEEAEISDTDSLSIAPTSNIIPLFGPR